MPVGDAPHQLLLGYDPAVLTLVQQALGLIDPGAVAARCRLTCVLHCTQRASRPRSRHELIALHNKSLGRETRRLNLSHKS